MTNVLNLQAERERRETEAWLAYTAAKERADRTHNVEDGRKAGLAWRAFLELYQTPAQTEFMGGSVARLERRA